VGSWWGAAGLYGLGVLTGAVLCGWSPQWLERWQARRQAGEGEFKDQFKRMILLKDWEKVASKSDHRRFGFEVDKAVWWNAHIAYLELPYRLQHIPADEWCHD
jgi:hypothetical protein